MTAFFLTYPYLLCSLLLGGGFALLLSLAPARHRTAALVSGALMTPFAFTSVLVVPEYWDPVRWRSFGAGVEDLLLSFSGGGTIWLFGALLSPWAWTLRLQKARVVRRLALAAASGMAPAPLFHYVWGWKPMSTMLACFGLVSLGILLKRTGYWRIAVPAALGHGIWYLAVLKGLYLLFPAFMQQWNPAGLWGPTFWGLPLDEIAWGFAVGFSWALVAAYLFDARGPIRPAGAPEDRPFPLP